MPQNITAANSRLSLPGGTPYRLANGYPKIQLNANREGSATEVLLIDPRNFDALVADMMPTPTVVNGKVQFTPRYFLPGTDFLVMESITAEPQSEEMPCDPFEADTDAPAGTYDSILKVTVAYKTGPQSQEDQDEANPETFLERSRTSSIELLTIQGAGHNTKFGEDGSTASAKNPMSPIIKVIPVVYWQMDWKRVTAPNFVAMDALMGTVNDDAYPWLENAPAESTLFLGASAKQEYQYVGNRLVIKPWTVGLKFATKRIADDNAVGDESDFFADIGNFGWNHVYNPTTHHWERLHRMKPGGVSSPLYPLMDFNEMFKPLTTTS
jgi:hypothetical protein